MSKNLLKNAQSFAFSLSLTVAPALEFSTLLHNPKMEMSLLKYPKNLLPGLHQHRHSSYFGNVCPSRLSHPAVMCQLDWRCWKWSAFSSRMRSCAVGAADMQTGGTRALEECQMAICQPRHNMVATAKPAGSLLLQLVQKLPGSLYSRNIQAFTCIIYAMCFSVFTT